MPSKDSALPKRPVVHVAPEMLPLLPRPETSVVVEPAPSLNPKAATEMPRIVGSLHPLPS